MSTGPRTAEGLERVRAAKTIMGRMELKRAKRGAYSAS
jgi:hypothetical protein